MRMVNRMIDITDGDILIGGRSVRDRKPSELRRETGYVIQQIGLFPHRTIGENIATVPHLLGWDKKRTRERVEELLAIIGLPVDFKDRYPTQLSGGQRQRLCPHGTSGETTGAGPPLLGWEKRRPGGGVGGLLAIIGPPADFRARSPPRLPGAQRRRVGAARAPAADPPLMLMDEPFGA